MVLRPSPWVTRIGTLPRGGSIVVVGPRLSGRSALVRRVAWSLGVEGRAVAWIEPQSAVDVNDAVTIELAGLGDAEDGVVLIDDADTLSPEAHARLQRERERGRRIVRVVTESDVEIPSDQEIFAMTPLSRTDAEGLVRRAIPSLSDAVLSHVIDRAGGWPGKLRAIVGRLERTPVVSPADVDQLLTEAGMTHVPLGAVAEIRELLDRGRFDEAAERLLPLADDVSPEVVIARARLATNRGEPQKALAELASAQETVEARNNAELSATWFLCVARAQLRAGNHVEAEEAAREAVTCLSQPPKSKGRHRHMPTLASGKKPTELVANLGNAQAVLVEALTAEGLAQSYGSRPLEARATLEKSVQIARTLVQPRIVAQALTSLAFALQRNGELVESATAYEEALGAAEEGGDAGLVATIRLNLATIAKTRGDLASALVNFEAAVDMGQRSGRLATLRQALLNLANLDLYLGRIARARVSLDTLAGQRDDLSPLQKAQLLSLEAEHATRAGDPSAGERLCAECALAYEAVGMPSEAAEARLERVLAAAALPSVDLDDLSRELERATVLLGTGASHRALLALATGRLLARRNDESGARAAYEKALVAAKEAGERDLVWRALDARSALEMAAGQPLKARRDREAALTTLEEIAERLPRDLREVYWNDPRRRALRSSLVLDVASGPTLTLPQLGEDRLARVLEINREIAGEHDLSRLLVRVTDHAIALLRAERGFVILRADYAADPATPRADTEGVSDTKTIASVPSSTGGPAELAIFASRDHAGGDAHAQFSRSIAERVVRTGEGIVTASAREDARMAEYVSVHQLMLQSIACVPIRARVGEVIGALYLETRLRPASSFQEELPILMTFADQVAIAIATARLIGENARRARELAKANAELEAARRKLEDTLGHRTAQLEQTRRDLRSTRAVLRGHFGYEGLVGTSEAMRRVYALIDRIKDTDIPVLITGESGTGKEIVARAIHNAGPRAKKPFVGINCGAIPEHLLESELFGHVRGAFTSADRDRKGLFREASDGTILLDEIGEMPQKMQAGLLRVLQERVVRPVGGPREEPVNTRVIAATHRDLASMVSESRFREDLFYRLNVIPVNVPALRERLEDIPLLIDHFLRIFAARYGRDRRSVSRAALKRLMGYPWPGNVRQLENVLLNAWVLSDRPELDTADFELPETLRGGIRPRTTRGEPEPVEVSLVGHKNREKDRMLAALSDANWNRVRAAQLIGMPRRTFYRRLKEYGIQ